MSDYKNIIWLQLTSIIIKEVLICIVLGAWSTFVLIPNCSSTSRCHSDYLVNSSTEGKKTTFIIINSWTGRLLLSGCVQLVDGCVLSVTDWDEGVKTVGYWKKNATNQDAQWGWRVRVTEVEVTAITHLAINITEHVYFCLKSCSFFLNWIKDFLQQIISCFKIKKIQ